MQRSAVGTAVLTRRKKIFPYAAAIAEVTVSSGTIAKCSFPSSSYEIIKEVFFNEKLTKSLCGLLIRIFASIAVIRGQTSRFRV